jgi:alpha-tubulin suppressor-like RCC1 family protein
LRAILTPLLQLCFIVTYCAAISIGSSHSVAVGRGGDCFVWGDGDAGQLGLGKLENKPQVSINNSFPSVMEVSAGANHTAVLTKSGQVREYARSNT